ncbi:MAG: Gfo/Idh/MocA family protein [Limnochordia bacterium]|jgi:virulence factor
MIRLGIVDFDSSHTVAFTQILNHTHPSQEQWVEGAKIVAGCALPSEIQTEAKVREYAERCAAYGVEMVSSPEELIGKVDGVMLESDDGRTHLERARLFLQAGVPTWIDKPLTFSLAEGREILQLAATHKAPLFSASSLRFASEVADVRQNKETYGGVLGAITYSPAKDQGPNPGLIYYGIHAIEMLYGLMGAGCQWVSSAESPHGIVVTGQWDDGRICSLRGTTEGAHSYGFTAWCEKTVVQKVVNASFIYRELMKQVVRFFQTGVSPVAPEETLETIAFGRAALASLQRQGQRVSLERC